jgi:hypothetical protein
MKVNFREVVRGAEECYRYLLRTNRCCVCGELDMPSHQPLRIFGTYCHRHCPVCTIAPGVDVDAVAQFAEEN